MSTGRSSFATSRGLIRLRDEAPDPMVPLTRAAKHPRLERGRCQKADDADCQHHQPGPVCPWVETSCAVRPALGLEAPTPECRKGREQDTAEEKQHTGPDEDQPRLKSSLRTHRRHSCFRFGSGVTCKAAERRGQSARLSCRRHLRLRAGTRFSRSLGTGSLGRSQRRPRTP